MSTPKARRPAEWKGRVALDGAVLSAATKNEVLFALTITKAWSRQVIVALPLMRASSFL
jgi:hypothetical protein